MEFFNLFFSFVNLLKTHITCQQKQGEGDVGKGELDLSRDVGRRKPQHSEGESYKIHLD